ncbi:hypothetical protein BJP27_24445 (plasmid) [Pseudomonas oryzihabitans]|nr:hypothetical protein BJP27_24445 [Pseudomonas psychrotolerans]
MDAFEAGFTSKAAQKRAFDSLNRAASLLKDDVHRLCWDLAKQNAANKERTDGAYWMNLDLHVWSAKRRAELLGYLPEAEAIANQYDDLAALRTSIKSAPIVPVERKQCDVTTKALTTLRELMEKRGQQYARGVRLTEVFGRLPVYANAHLVTNQHGTTFVRVFWFMLGELTPLSMIMAVLQSPEARAAMEAKAALA